MEKNLNGTNVRVTAATLLVALGIIYGDIGTSPLYALRAVIGEREVTQQLVYGGVSCIFWTLLFQTTVKYIWLTLKADNQGEGGIFSLYSLVKRFGKKLVIPAILGATTLLADGIITPPISVASAIEGLGMVDGLTGIIVPGNAITIGIVVVILTALFFFQRFGTEKIGRAFGPLMAIWFLMLLLLGLYNIGLHPSILAALSPTYAYDLLAHYPQGFWLLGAVFLCTTGAEALYSDLGHCGIKNIRLTWIFVKTSLVVNYLGQASWIMGLEGSALQGRNPFFEIVPELFLLPSILIATMAAIIASQALISGSFTLINEAISLNFWPRVAVRQPTEVKGQIYIPSVNTILWVGCILMILYFRESTHMEAAYGFSITITMLMTTVLMCYFIYYRLRWDRIYVWLFGLTFGAIETAFFIANVAKIRERWMFLFFELFIFMTMYVWYNARKINNRFTKFVDLGKYAPQLTALSQDDEVPKFATHLIYLTKANKRHEIEEKIIQSIFSKKSKRADVYWFLHIHRTQEPYTLAYDVTELVDDKVIKIDIHVGFRIQPKTESYFKKIIQELVVNKELNLHVRPDGSSKYNSEPDFKFVVIEKYLSVENEFALKEGVLLNTYFFLKNLSLSDERAFGLEKSDVVVEYIPLLYQPHQQLAISRLVKNEHLKMLSLLAIPFCMNFLQAQTPVAPPRPEPFQGIDMTWQNGSDRRTTNIWKDMKYFTPSIFIDVNYTHSFNDPIDNTVVGSTALARNNEIQLSALHFGGDFHYKGARARIMTQFGTRSQVVPRNDFSPYRGQYQLANVYRFLSEAYAGYHIDKWHGINIDAGLFMSYIGLNSFYQAENWEYQASFTSDNTPWFFNGIRVQIHPTKNLKIEPWIINGWQSYGKFNSMPGFGGNITWVPNDHLKLLTNNYFGTDAAGIPKRKRFHSDNSILYRYYHKPQSGGITQMAFSLTGDVGFEKGGGVNGFRGGDSVQGPAQYFASAMLYHRMWFAKNKMAWTIGGGWMTNPGRYLVLYPSGQASPLPNPNNPTQTEGAFPFSANPGDAFSGWDCSTNLDFMPNQSITYRFEFVHRNSSVPYFAGRGGVTSQTGYSTAVLDPAWRPDLVKSESRIIFAMLFRL